MVLAIVQGYEMVLRIALTGGIGSGKSTVSQLFAKLGAEMIDADQIAHELTQCGKLAYQQIVEHFGSSFLLANQQLDRKKLRHCIFKSNQAKTWLEKMLHPMILETIRQKIINVRSSYCIIVIPLLTETTLKIDFIDRVCVIDAPIHLRKQWATTRDEASLSEITAIMSQQNSSSRRLAIADDVITNDQDMATLQIQVEKLHHQYLQMGRS